MRLILSVLALATMTASAQAEDFTGFYAGVNAGYAASPNADRPRLTLDGPSPSAADDSALPPSARSAAGAMQDKRENGRRNAGAVR